MKISRVIETWWSSGYYYSDFLLIHWFFWMTKVKISGRFHFIFNIMLNNSPFLYMDYDSISASLSFYMMIELFPPLKLKIQNSVVPFMVTNRKLFKYLEFKVIIFFPRWGNAHKLTPQKFMEVCGKYFSISWWENKTSLIFQWVALEMISMIISWNKNKIVNHLWAFKKVSRFSRIHFNSQLITIIKFNYMNHEGDYDNWVQGKKWNWIINHW